LDYLRRFETVASSCKKAIDYLAQLDVLLSLSTYATQLENACRPEFISDKETRTNDRDGAMLQIKGMRHPYAKPQAGHVFVPNDITLGGGRPKMMLITGPNMGGKSTLLRQVCILVIMAQIGSYVPAESCILTVADRIFTRVGARDNIYGGLSTFMIELEETSKMLKYATNQSIIILDELGRGTSTFDGYAIAFAVLKHLETMDCRVLFSTHYHKLTDEFNNNSSQQQKSWGTHPKVALGHMACKEEGYAKREATSRSNISY
jgi:DNA mismatch repair protein MSH6